MSAIDALVANLERVHRRVAVAALLLTGGVVLPSVCSITVPTLVENALVGLHLYRSGDLRGLLQSVLLLRALREHVCISRRSSRRWWIRARYRLPRGGTEARNDPAPRSAFLELRTNRYERQRRTQEVVP